MALFYSGWIRFFLSSVPFCGGFTHIVRIMNVACPSEPFFFSLQSCTHIAKMLNFADPENTAKALPFEIGAAIRSPTEITTTEMRNDIMLI
jgi:hypothetical protein